jgi:hypothetical protein
MSAASADDVLASLPGDLVPGGGLIGQPRTSGGGRPAESSLSGVEDFATKPLAPLPTPPPGPSSDLPTKIINSEGLGKNPNSSAQGTGGFLDSTWLQITMGEPEVAGKTPEQVLQMRVTDPDFAKRMVQKSLGQYTGFLQQNNLPVNDETLYLTHFFGGAGAKAILTAPPDTPLVKIFAPSVIQANPQIASLTTSSILPFLKQTLDRTGPPNSTDPATQQHQQTIGQLDSIGAQMKDLIAKMGQAPPGSDEQHQILRQAMQRSQQLADRFDKLSQKPPQQQSPFEAMSGFAPLLIGMTMMLGRTTRRPGLAAINALSSGLAGLKQGNDEQYQRAMDVWSKQNDLAAKAFDMQNKMIDNIMSDINLTAKEQQDKLMNAFRVLGLEQDLTLAKANQWDQVYKRQEDRQKLADDHSIATATIDHLRAQTAREQAIAALGGSTTPAMIAYNKAKQAFVAENNREPSPAEDQKLLTDALAATKSAGRVQSPEMKAVDDALIARANELGVDPDEFKTDPKYAKDRAEVEQKAHTQRITHDVQITGNERVRLDQRAEAYRIANYKIDQLEDILARNNFVSGIGGKITRPLEVLANISGWSDETDRKMFESGIAYLQAMTPRLIQQSDSRGVAGEFFGTQQRIDKIIRGLNMGDTAANTVESLRELKELMTELGQTTVKILKGTYQPPAEFDTSAPTTAPAAPAAAPPTPPPANDNPWSSFQLQQ